MWKASSELDPYSPSSYQRTSKADRPGTKVVAHGAQFAVHFAPWTASPSENLIHIDELRGYGELFSGSAHMTLRGKNTATFGVPDLPKATASLLLVYELYRC
jgi:hypothetical protein